eukprot:GILK01004040.1.p1 GENE.GILK01004040.1~~GILK01004040.1.p1  ORF type:complete len:203 (+),score=28.83 GILK01004040.1:61-669(+)
MESDSEDWELVEAEPLPPHYDHTYQVIMLGGNAVGKSHLFTQYIHGRIEEPIGATIGVDAMYKTVQLQVGGTVRGLFLDTAGLQRFRPGIAPLYSRVEGALVVYDITYANSFEDAKVWLEDFRKDAQPGIVVMLVGNKLDLVESKPDRREVETEFARSFAAENNLLFEEVSAKTSHNVTAAFETLLQAIYNQQEGQSNTTST